ncbi:Acyl carrier protein [gamma proteobacterium HdN1]|nr:Acyl carrier protein [gamma proteobacterium HdN1]
MSLETQAEIFEVLREIMCELFELEASRIQLNTRLYDDLEIDSIDAVDLMDRIRKLTGKKVSPEDFKSVVTLQDIVATIERLVQEKACA